MRAQANDIMIKQIEKEESVAQPTDTDRRMAGALVARRLERYALELSAAKAEMDTFAHSISHDLRSPLTIVLGFAELLTKHSGNDLDEKGRHYLKRITAATLQIARMLDEILALSLMSRSEMRCVRFDLEALVKKVVSDLDASKGDRRVIWLVGRLAPVMADPALLRRAITSLASNALFFTRSREVARIQIGMLDVHDGDNELTFFVRDNGAGVSIKHRERMFGSIDGQNSPSPAEGSATELAHVQRIFQRHGGRMWMEAVPDGGATFYFSIPDACEETDSL